MSQRCSEHQKEIHNCLKIEENYLRRELAAAQEEIKLFKSKDHYICVIHDSWACNECVKEMRKLEHQNQKLRQALEKIAKEYGCGSSDIAKQALAEGDR